MARVEDYPELQASQQVEQLQRTLNEVEAQIAAARRTYNAAVTDLNVSMESFPTNLVAGSLGFERKPLFEAEAGEKAVPAVAATAGR
jgi:LemA protein